MEEVELLEEEVEQQFSEKTAEMESAAEWQAKATTDGEDAWEIMVIYPLMRRQNCSRGDCKNRASHRSSWTR
jgi:hypothetical protein